MRFLPPIFSFFNFFFFFNDTATTEIYTLSLHDALPILRPRERSHDIHPARWVHGADMAGDRKSTRLNSSHGYNSYAVFCLKKKNKKILSEANTIAAERLVEKFAE